MSKGNNLEVKREKNDEQKKSNQEGKKGRKEGRKKVTSERKAIQKIEFEFKQNTPEQCILIP